MQQLAKSANSGNHLGNVLSVISDTAAGSRVANPIPHVNGTTVDYYMADIRQATDYSPFGAQLYGRNFTLAGSEDHRYGFQNQEEDDELKGEGNSLNFTFRMYDPRIGRFFAIDPLAKKYPYMTPYQFCSNNPIWLMELEGLEGTTATHKLYFSTAGIEVFINDLELGFSPLGAAFALAQSAWESGYGDPDALAKSIRKNNFWGLKGDYTLSFTTFDEGYARWQTMMNERFPKAIELMKKEDFSVEDMQKALIPGADAPYNYDKVTNTDYAERMLGESVNILKRMIITAEEMIVLKEERAKSLVVGIDSRGRKKFNNAEDKKTYFELQKHIKYFKGVIEKAKVSIDVVEKKLGETEK